VLKNSSMKGSTRWRPHPIRPEPCPVPEQVHSRMTTSGLSLRRGMAPTTRLSARSAMTLTLLGLANSRRTVCNNGASACGPRVVGAFRQHLPAIRALGSSSTKTRLRAGFTAAIAAMALRKHHTDTDSQCSKATLQRAQTEPALSPDEAPGDDPVSSTSDDAEPLSFSRHQHQPTEQRHDCA